MMVKAESFRDVSLGENRLKDVKLFSSYGIYIACGLGNILLKKMARSASLFSPPVFTSPRSICKSILDEVL